jgi:REP element-mobilizing transposase RayT
MDGKLDSRRHGPVFLQMREIAEVVATAIQTGDGYQLHEWVIMPNHVHVLFTPHVAPPLVLRRWKGSTAREANKLLCRTGARFWQEESYDRLVRNPEEFEAIRAYIRMNPVRAGLASAPEEFPWSSAYVGRASARGGLQSAKPVAELKLRAD